MRNSMFVSVDEVMIDWGVCKTKAYQIIKNLNNEMKQKNPQAIIIAGKCNRKYYEESCCGAKA